MMICAFSFIRTSGHAHGGRIKCPNILQNAICFCLKKDVLKPSLSMDKPLKTLSEQPFSSIIFSLVTIAAKPTTKTYQYVFDFDKVHVRALKQSSQSQNISTSQYPNNKAHPILQPGRPLYP